MEEENGAVERMQDSLYSRGGKTGVRPRAQLTGQGVEKPQGWAHAPEVETEIPMMREPRKPFPLTAFFLGSLLFFVMAVGVAAYTFLVGGNTVSPENITLNILGPSLVDGGKEATFQVTIENRNGSEIQLADLVIEYPEGTRMAEDVTEPLQRQRISLGTIESGATRKETVRAVLFGEEGTLKHITASLEYRVEGSNAIFVKEGALDVLLGASPVAISIEAPDEVISGQEITFKVSIRSNAQGKVENVALEAQYPFGFSVTGAEPETSVGEAIWQLGDLEPGTEKTITIQGVLDGQDNEERVFRFLAGSEDDKTAAHIKVPYLTMPHALTMKRPFVTAELSLNGDMGKSVVVSPGATVRGEIRWQNNLDTEIQDLVIEAKLSGQALDRGSVIAPRGFYRSLDSTIIWSKADDETMATVAAGSSGRIDFSFTPTGSSGAGALTNPEIQLAVSVSAKRTNQGNVPESISSAFIKTVRVGSALTIGARTKHFSGPIPNTGPMPPAVDQETTYAVVWTVRNPSNTISSAKASATLPSYVKFLGVVSPGTENVSYDDRSRTVTWNLGDVKAGVGFAAAAREVAFKVGLTPSLSQVGSSPALTGRIIVAGDDRFTGGRVSAEAEAVTTFVTGGESGYVQGMDRVVQ